jgi:hypothetical protein
VSDVDFQARWAALENPPPPPPSFTESVIAADAELWSVPPDKRLYHPLSEAADDYIRWCQSPHERIYTGIEQLDEEMRGTAPGELTMILGFSHSGKTLVLNHILRAMRDKRVLFFQPDEPRVLTLVKLACAHHNIPAKDLEARIAADDAEARRLLRSTAEEHFPDLAVIDDPLSTSTMERAYNEVCDVWGAAPEMVVVDFLELLGDLELVPQKANFVKGFGRRHAVPMFVLHQVSRTAGADGKKLTIASGAYGGETQSTHLIGVRRRKAELLARLEQLEQQRRSAKDTSWIDDEIAEVQYELRIHEFTITVSLVKNKRPGGDLLPEVDFELMKSTGRLVQLNGEQPQQYRNLYGRAA